MGWKRQVWSAGPEHPRLYALIAKVRRETQSLRPTHDLTALIQKLVDAEQWVKSDPVVSLPEAVERVLTVIARCRDEIGDVVRDVLTRWGRCDDASINVILSYDDVLRELAGARGALELVLSTARTAMTDYAASRDGDTLALAERRYASTVTRLLLAASSMAPLLKLEKLAANGGEVMVTPPKTDSDYARVVIDAPRGRSFEAGRYGRVDVRQGYVWQNGKLAERLVWTFPFAHPGPQRSFSSLAMIGQAALMATKRIVTMAKRGENVDVVLEDALLLAEEAAQAGYEAYMTAPPVNTDIVGMVAPKRGNFDRAVIFQQTVDRLEEEFPTPTVPLTYAISRLNVSALGGTDPVGAIAAASLVTELLELRLTWTFRDNFTTGIRAIFSKMGE